MKEVILSLFAGTVLGFVIGALFGVVTTTNDYVEKSLKGYEAVATYKTNDLGEVSIVSVRWQPMPYRKHKE